MASTQSFAFDGLVAAASRRLSPKSTGGYLLAAVAELFEDLDLLGEAERCQARTHFRLTHDDLPNICVQNRPTWPSTRCVRGGSAAFRDSLHPVRQTAKSGCDLSIGLFAARSRRGARPSSPTL